MITYIVVGFPISGGCATFQKEYKRRKNAENTQKKLISSGNYKNVMLRQEEILLDNGNDYISISKPINELECSVSGKIKMRTI